MCSNCQNILHKVYVWFNKLKHNNFYRKNLFQSSVYKISPSTHFTNIVRATCCGRECKSSHCHLSEPRILLCLRSFIFSSSLHQAFIRSSCCASQQLFTGNYPARAARLLSQSAFPRRRPRSAPHSLPLIILALPWPGCSCSNLKEPQRRERGERNNRKDRVKEWAPPPGYSSRCWHTRCVTSPLTHTLAQTRGSVWQTRPLSDLLTQ